MNELESRPLIHRVVGAAYEVANELGPGFLEKVYERALEIELRIRGVGAIRQARLPVYFKGECVGEYAADLLVEQQLIVELKCAESFGPEHIAQCLNYLRASHLTTALLLNFQHPKVQWRRVVASDSIHVHRRSFTAKEADSSPAEEVI